MPIVKDGLSLWVVVNGFQEAKQELYQLISAGIVRCTGGNCNHPATHVYWQDQAEWYEHCEDHRDHGPQWTGSTRWQSDVLSVAVLPDNARAWLASLPEAERAHYHEEAYDRRDLYSLLPEDHYQNHRSEKFGFDPAKPEWYTEVEIYPLTNGEFAYQIGISRPRVHHSFGLVGTFDSSDEALTHARSQDKDFPERYRVESDDHSQDTVKVDILVDATPAQPVPADEASVQSYFIPLGWMHIQHDCPNCAGKFLFAAGANETGEPTSEVRCCSCFSIFQPGVTLFIDEQKAKPSEE